MPVRRPALAKLLAALAPLASFLSMATLASTAAAGPVTIPTSTADALQGAGQGLCVANAVSMNPLADFPPATAADSQNVSGFITGLNAFMEVNLATRVQYVQQTIFDLSNNQDTGAVKISYGDFTNSMSPQCLIGGCNFFVNDTTTSFGSRFRGFLNVTAAFTGIPIHIGFYSDDAVGLTFFDKSGNAYPVMGQAPYEGFPTWRLTETVTFGQTGLYPLEIVYAQIGDAAALEMSFFTGSFTDIHISANQVPITSLSTAGFTLFPVTDFFQTLSGEQSFPDVTQCEQCNREFVGQFGNNGCPAAYFCNEAALCAPCDSDEVLRAHLLAVRGHDAVLHQRQREGVVRAVPHQHRTARRASPAIRCSTSATSATSTATAPAATSACSTSASGARSRSSARAPRATAVPCSPTAGSGRARRSRARRTRAPAPRRSAWSARATPTAPAPTAAASAI